MKKNKILLSLMFFSVFNPQAYQTSSLQQKSQNLKKENLESIKENKNNKNNKDQNLSESNSKIKKGLLYSGLAALAIIPITIGVKQLIDCRKDEKSNEHNDEQPIHTTTTTTTTSTKEKTNQQTNQDTNLGLYEIPDEIYNISEKYEPDNSGLSPYSGTQASHEGHLEWESFNCWVLANLYFYFRPELKSTYENYAGKSIKDIIYNLDNLYDNYSTQVTAFCKYMSDVLQKLKYCIQNQNIEIPKWWPVAFFKIKIKEWNNFTKEQKLRYMKTYYTIQTLYRFHYAVALKNRCRIYVKMIKKPDKMVNVYKMNDFCKEGNYLPSFWFENYADIYIKAEKILGRRYYDGLEENIDDCILLEHFGKTSGKGGGGFVNFINAFSNDNDKDDNDKVGLDWLQESRGLRVEWVANKDFYELDPDVFKYGRKVIDGVNYRLVAIQMKTSEYGGHGRVIRLKYDNNLECTEIVDKDCYHSDDKVTGITKGKLFQCIFNHSKKWIHDKKWPYMEYLHFIKEDELRDNLEYYKE